MGAYVPTVVFFDPVTEDLDIPVISQHAVRLARAGVAGITTQGSNGEAVHLTHSERRTVTRVTRSALDAAGFSTLPIIVGCGAQSTRETIELCHEALESGGDYALVLPPSYYKPFLSTDALIQFFTDVATASPIPILIYNYPGAVSGTDLDSDAIISLANHPNIVGCKLTCGNTGKLLRIAEATGAWSPCSSSSLSASPSSSPTSSTQKFMCLGGSADFTLQALIAGGSGTISGLGNIAPKACARLIDLYASGQIQEARKLQAVVARGDWAAIRGGIIGTKAALQTFFGYGGYARRPLPRWGKGEVREIVEAFEELVELEKSL
ncbi:dihydrodipicolinate synthetase [Xylona heveae TC161]|uniref:Dihydrodipicolinate synthetase n=1 Tax=Xylona heveae (strain CBS 132557 / TC161) TaxID=1328760 RepID=A0A165JDB0_XYLHT|nr:dihydrodipicolinate synthetase [Xylona heveae TC161]KZF26085.1 dihydrodipicolinate synthetase [Xylona heveae TC161]